MNTLSTTHCIAFTGHTCIGKGSLQEVATSVKRWTDQHQEEAILIFDTVDSRPVELDLRGSLEDVLERLPKAPQEKTPQQQETPPATRSAGRPKLGVVPREITLLPRHWDWLKTQPGGASVTLRKLVEAAIQENREPDRRRNAQESCYRFMMAMAGNEPGFEEACRDLFASEEKRFTSRVSAWPADISNHVLTLAGPAFAQRTSG